MQPAMSAHLAKTAAFKVMSQSEPASEVPFANPMAEDVDRVLAQLGLSAHDLSAVAQ